jgi:hypothetical protein
VPVANLGQYDFMAISQPKLNIETFQKQMYCNVCFEIWLISLPASSRLFVLMVKIGMVSRTFVLLSLVLMTACSTTPKKESFGATDTHRLAARVQSYWAKWAQNDFQSVYQLESPRIRSLTSFEDWKRDYHLDEPQDAEFIRVLGGKIVRMCRCIEYERPDYPRVLRCPFVAEVSMSRGKSTLHERILEMWEYVDGEWYHGIDLEGQDCARLAQDSVT